MVVVSTYAPAASVGPSMPSVPTLPIATSVGSDASRPGDRQRHLLIAPAFPFADDFHRRLAAGNDGNGAASAGASARARSRTIGPIVRASPTIGSSLRMTS